MSGSGTKDIITLRANKEGVYVQQTGDQQKGQKGQKGQNKQIIKTPSARPHGQKLTRTSSKPQIIQVSPLTEKEKIMYGFRAGIKAAQNLAGVAGVFQGIEQSADQLIQKVQNVLLGKPK